MRHNNMNENILKRMISEHVKHVFESYYGEPQTTDSVMEEFNKLHSHSFDMSDYMYDGQPMSELGIGYDPEANTLYAGFIFNAGVSREWEMDYDFDFTFDENLQYLYSMIVEDPSVEYNDGSVEESYKRHFKNNITETVFRSVKSYLRNNLR